MEEKEEAALRSGVGREFQMKTETRNCDEKCEFENVS
jgi:hypothetical protein